MYRCGSGRALPLPLMVLLQTSLYTLSKSYVPTPKPLNTSRTHQYMSDTSLEGNSGPRLRRAAPKPVQVAKWTPEHENILVEWADKAACYRWLHTKCHGQFKRQNYWFTLPVIIMSTITGTANFAQDRFGEAIKPWVAVGIGAVNIFAGILTTIQQFLKIGELNEAHRVSSIAWDKFYRNMKVELAKAPKERTPVLQQLKSAKEEFDRLMETSPAISEQVILEFKKVFSGSETATRAQLAADLEARRKAFTELKKPEICDTIETTRSSVYKAPANPPPPSPTEASAAAALQATAEKRAVALTRALAVEAFKNRRGRPPTDIELAEMVHQTADMEALQADATPEPENVVIPVSTAAASESNQAAPAASPSEDN